MIDRRLVSLTPRWRATRRETVIGRIVREPVGVRNSGHAADLEVRSMRQGVVGALLILAERLSTALEVLERNPHERDGRSSRRPGDLSASASALQPAVGTEAPLSNGCAPRQRGSARPIGESAGHERDLSFRPPQARPRTGPGPGHHLRRLRVPHQVLCRPALGEVRLSELSPLHVQRLYSSLLVPERRLSAGTVPNLHLVLTQALGQAVRWGILERNP